MSNGQNESTVAGNSTTTTARPDDGAGFWGPEAIILGGIGVVICIGPEIYDILKERVS